MKHLQPNVLYGGPEPENFSDGAQSFAEFLYRRLAQHTDTVILVRDHSTKLADISESYAFFADRRPD